MLVVLHAQLGETDRASAIVRNTLHDDVRISRLGYLAMALVESGRLDDAMAVVSETNSAVERETVLCRVIHELFRQGEIAKGLNYLAQVNGKDSRDSMLDDLAAAFGSPRLTQGRPGWSRSGP